MYVSPLCSARIGLGEEYTAAGIFSGDGYQVVSAHDPKSCTLLAGRCLDGATRPVMDSVDRGCFVVTCSGIRILSREESFIRMLLFTSFPSVLVFLMLGGESY